MTLCRPIRHIILFLLSLIVASGSLYAKTGRSNLTLRQVGTGDSEVSVQVGQTVSVELWIEGDGEEITGSSVFLSFDDTALELIPQGFTGGGDPIPFAQGGFINGVVFDNNTINDQIGNSLANGLPLFQLRYFENIQSTPFGSSNPAIGNGRLATFNLRVLRKPEANTVSIRVDARSPVGSDTGYFKTGDPGTIYTFRSIKTMSITIQGLDLSVALPDLFLLPGQIDKSIDLDDFIDDPTINDSELTWTNSTPDPNNINVSIDPTTHVVTVDPLTFIGISNVTFTVDDGFGGIESDEIRVIVDTPPVFDNDAIPDNVQFDEDTVDSTLLLVATDADADAVLTYAADSTTAADTNHTISIDQTSGRVTLTPNLHYNGTETMTFNVSDQFGLTDTVAVDVIVNPVNDRPEFLEKPLPAQEVGVLGRVQLDLASRVRDVDDPLTDLQFTFGGVDSIAFDVTNNNSAMTITPVPPFMGAETVTVVVTDPSGAADMTTLRVEVLPPADPQPPEVTVDFLKVDVVSGSTTPANITLDDLVSDLDHADDDLTWVISPVSLISVNAQKLTQRILSVSAPLENVGYATATLTVTDPTNLQDTLAVHFYASSVGTGVPETGGLPDLVLGAGQAEDIILNNYYFDADHSGDQVTWTTTGEQNVMIAIDPQTNVATVTAPTAITNQIENVTFTVADPDQQTSSVEIRVTLVPEGGVVIDLSTIGGRRDIGIGIPDTLSLDQLLVVGTPSNIVWSAESRDAQTILAQVLDGSSLQLIGFVEGETEVVVTATDTSTVNSSTGTIRVVASKSTNPGDLSVRDIGALTLRANRDTTIGLSELIVAGNPASVTWSSQGNVNVGVEIDNVTKEAILRPVLGFVGDAGPIVFTADDVNSDFSVFSTAAPVTVEGATGSSRGLLEVSLIANPIRKNFLDAFVVSRLELLSLPIVEVIFDLGDKATPNVLRIEPVEVDRIWVGDFIIDDETTGTVRIAATGIMAAETPIALTDTVTIEIGETGITNEFQIVSRGAEVSLPLGSVDRRTKVALFKTTSLDGGSDQGLKPVSHQYVVHAAGDGNVVSPGSICLDIQERPDDRMGIYRKVDGRWAYVPTRIERERLVGDFTAFGTYGAFLDELGQSRIERMTLYPNFPNPFNPETQIRFDIAESGYYELLIYNVLGQQVRSLARETFSPGAYRMAWDARDDFGQTVGAGVYLYRLVSARDAITRKMMLLK